MTIRYFWEDVIVNKPCSGGLSPRTTPVRQNVEYDYECQITSEDIVNYLMPYYLIEENKKIANHYMKKALDFLINNLQLSCELDALKKDEYFVEFMKERNEDKAYEEWEETNDAY